MTALVHGQVALFVVLQMDARLLTPQPPHVSVQFCHGDHALQVSTPAQALAVEPELPPDDIILDIMVDMVVIMDDMDDIIPDMVDIPLIVLLADGLVHANAPFTTANFVYGAHGQLDARPVHIA